MVKPFRKIYPLYVAVDLVLMAAGFFLSYMFRYNFFAGAELPNVKGYFFVFVLWAIFIVVSFKSKKLYTTDRGLSIPREISRVVTSIFYTSILIAAVIFFSKYKFFSRLVFLGSFLALCIFLASFRVIKKLILRKLIRQGFHNLNILIIGAGRRGEIILDEIKKSPYWGLKVVGFLDDNTKEAAGGVPVLGKIKNFSAVAKKFFIDEVIIADSPRQHSVSELVKEAKNLRLGIKVAPGELQESLPVVDISYLGFIPLLSYKERKHHPAEFALKRLLDFLISLILLILLSPLFVIIVILIKLGSEGPVFYIQRRAGFKGKLFNCYKFRSMLKNAEELKMQLLEKNEVKDGVIFKIKKDPRITPIGRLLRRCSLDELPQLFNVLKGDMSLVGPRPPTFDEVEKYNYEQTQRLSIRPGITGLSQVRGRSELTFRKWVKWDLWYINNWSFILDLKIIAWTIPVVLSRRGAY